MMAFSDFSIVIPREGGVSSTRSAITGSSAFADDDGNGQA